MRFHRGSILAVQRAKDERREVIAPPGAALGHLLLSLPPRPAAFPAGPRQEPW
jgi:hypothetical protein